MDKIFIMAQLKEVLDIHENATIRIFTNRIENLQSKITRIQEKHKQPEAEVKALLESTEFQNETYQKMKKKHEG